MNEVLKVIYYYFYTGHGKFGDKCAHFARDHLANYLLNNQNYSTDFLKAYKDAFRKTNADLHKLSRQPAANIDDSMSGTTAVTVVFRGTEIYVANVGDSRIIMCQKDDNNKNQAVALSIDQTPFREDERKRCQRAGAQVLTMDQVEGLKDPSFNQWGNEEDDGMYRYAYLSIFTYIYIY